MFVTSQTSTDVNKTIVEKAALAKRLIVAFLFRQSCVTNVMSCFCFVFQIPRYIITLHELLAHTPHEHVERKSLEFAKSKLEELSK